MTKNPEMPVGLARLLELEQMLLDIDRDQLYYFHGEYMRGREAESECGSDAPSYIVESAMEEFGISYAQAQHLFNEGEVRSALEEAQLVRAVIDRKLAELNEVIHG